MCQSIHIICIYPPCWVFVYVRCIRCPSVTDTLCGWPCQMEGCWASIQNSSFRYIWFRVHSNQPPFTLVCLSLNLAPSNGNRQTDLRCKYKCHCNYNREKSANKVCRCVFMYMSVSAWKLQQSTLCMALQTVIILCSFQLCFPSSSSLFSDL